MARLSLHTENDQFNPASTLKLATALVALRTLWHRFATGVWTDGVIDKTTGVLNGSLLYLWTRSVVSL